jgi:iron complex outermembrane receptor protein
VDTGNIGEESMTVHDVPYSIKYQLENMGTGLKFTAGINGMYEFNKNFPEPPAPYIGFFELPNYNLFDIGAYGILQWDYKNLTLSAGFRYDSRTVNSHAMYLSNVATPEQEQVAAGTPGAYQEFASFKHTYSGPSASLGASYQLPANNYIKLNLALSYRAPAINELTSNELNFGANAYDLGNTKLKAEQGYESDLVYGNNGKNVSLEADGFCNYINNFIFTDRLPGSNGSDSITLGYPTFQFLSNTAIITGVAAYFNIHPQVAKWIEIDNGLTYIYSFMLHQSDSTQHVPFTPAPRLTSEVKFKIPTGKSVFSSLYIEVGLAHYWAQNNIYSALFTELPSQAYTLYNAGIGTNFVSKKTNRVVCSLFINCSNLTNLAYVDHLSHNQYFTGRDGVIGIVTQQSQGIYNMGRNLGVKILVPFGGHKISGNETKQTDINSP